MSYHTFFRCNYIKFYEKKFQLSLKTIEFYKTFTNFKVFAILRGKVKSTVSRLPVKDSTAAFLSKEAGF